MAEYIEREALLLEAERDSNFNLVVRAKTIQNFPAADVAPVRHGRWVEFSRAHYFKCSECKHTVPYRKASLVNGFREYNFCPACGCKMNLEDEP